MPEDLSPGVYVEELEFGAKPIEGVATSTAAFLGAAERGPLQPRLVTGWPEYLRVYGGFRVPPYSQPDESLPIAVYSFFQNGGRRVFVTRIVKAPVDAAGASTAEVGPLGGIRYRASGPGTWGGRVFLQFTNTAAEADSPPVAPTHFRVRVYYWADDIDAAQVGTALNGTAQQRAALPQPTCSEDYDDLDLLPDSPNFVANRINAGSELVALFAHDEVSMPVLDGAYIQLVVDLDDGDGVLPLTAADFDGQPAGPEPLSVSWGIAALAEPPCGEVAIVYAPQAATDQALRGKLIDHCEDNRHRFFILDSEPNRSATAELHPRNERDTKYAALYYPWVLIEHPRSNQTVKVAPGGSIAGIYARCDVERGVWKAPANESVRGAIDLEFHVSKSQQDVLNPRGVNVIRAFPARGIRVWGSRTLSSDPEWRYVNVRRLFIFLEASIDRGLQWVVFEPNGEALWARARRTIEHFLLAQWRAGALMGLKPEEAFFVKVGRTTMTQDDIDNGRLIVLIGIAPVRPAEFIIFRIAQFTADRNA